MGKKYTGNAGFMGTGSHLEVHYEPGKKNSKYKCPNYNKEIKDCRILGITCVGLSNPMCPMKKYGKNSKNTLSDRVNETTKPTLKKEQLPDYKQYMNKRIVHKNYGEGIIKNINGEKVTILFGNKQSVFSMTILLNEQIITIK